MKAISRSAPTRLGAGLLISLFVAGSITTATAQTATPMVQLLNPSGHSLIVSDKAAPFHLNAWTGGMTQSAVVEFEIQATGSPVTTIGTAQRVGTDTFEYFWDVPTTMDNGTYTLRAILYSSDGTTFREVARDSQTVELMHKSDPVTAAAESTEITYPVNGGPAGFFPAPGKQPSLIMDLKSSAGTTRARVFYSVTTPGEEPQWKTCGTETAAQAADGVRCLLAAGDAVSAVTAVAAVANTTPVAPGIDLNAGLNAAGDAHRIFGYDQMPSSLTIAPQTQRVDAAAGIFPCSKPIIATVSDQQGRKVAGANVDVYATGPSDQLAFDTSNQSAVNQPPDQRQIAAEPAFNCSSGTVGGLQGDDNRVAESDRKHIESTPGTNDAGQVDFKLHSDSIGVTRITAWADTNGNDFFCTSEPHADATISWGADLASPTAQPADPEGCVIASPSPTTPITAPPTGTATAPPTGTATAPPTGTATAPPTRATVEVTLESSKSEARWGNPYDLAGRVTSDAPGCTSLATVTITRDVLGGEQSDEEVGTTITDADGSFSMSRNADSSALYTARTSGSETCDPAVSSGVSVLVRKKVAIEVASRGDGIKAKVRPCAGHGGERVTLQRKTATGFKRVARTRSDNRCIALFDGLGRGVYRAVASKTDEDHLRGVSGKVRV